MSSNSKIEFFKEIYKQNRDEQRKKYTESQFFLQYNFKNGIKNILGDQKADLQQRTKEETILHQINSDK